MNRKILLRLFALVACLLCSMSAVAAEAYACYTSSNKTLTFYYDNQRSSRTGTTYDLNTGTDSPGWFNISSSITKVVFNSTFASVRPTTTNAWFASMSNLQSITGTQYLNTSQVTDMSWMFYDSGGTSSLNLNWLNTSKVTDMNNMFSYCKYTTITFSNFNTANVTDMEYMFAFCDNLTSLNLSSFNTANVKNMSWMFNESSHLRTINLSNWNTSKVTDMNSMFCNCTGLTSLDLSSFNTANVTNMSGMFGGCSALTSLDVSGFNTAKVTDMSGMFSCCDGLTCLDVSNFNTAKVTDMSGMFEQCDALTTLDLANFNTANVTNMSDMFYGCQELVTIMVGSGWSTNKVTASTNMFKNCTKIKGQQGTTYNANYVDKTYARVDGGTSNPGYLSLRPYTFVSNGIYYNKLTSNTVEVTYKDYNYMSYNGTVTIPATVSNGGTTYRVTAIGENAFRGCTDLFAVNIGRNVTSIGKKAFQGCTKFTNFTIPNQVTTIGQQAFYACTNLSSLTLGSDMQTLGSGVCAGCDNFTVLNCSAVTPPTLTSVTFSSTQYNKVSLLVPDESLNAYKAATYWKNFKSINAFPTVDVVEDVDFFFGPLKGDMNDDHKVNVTDVVELINRLLTGTASGGTNSGLPVNNAFTVTVKGVSFSMIPVQGGTFWMGDTGDQQGWYRCTENPNSETFASRRPVHQVTLSNYFIGMTEVTQELWEAVMGTNPSYYTSANGFDDCGYGYHFTDLQNRPVEQVSWNDCRVFIIKLNAMTGLNFRFPTEAEWEYAARGGVQSKHYHFSGSSNLQDVAWGDGYYAPIVPVWNGSGTADYVYDPSQTCGETNKTDRTQPVAKLSCNELFLFDMTGNVAEWCQDWYGSYSSEHQTDPQGPASGSKRVVRGGSFEFYYHDGNPVSIGAYGVSFRDWESPSFNSHVDSNGNTRVIGLRLAM